MNTALTFGKWRGLAQIADDRGRFKMLAIDQRPPLQKLVAAAKQKADARDVAAIKRALVAELSPQSSAVLMDPIYALPGGANYLAPHCGLIVTLEDHRFSDTDGGRVSRVIPNWSVEKIKRMGGDAVKILVWYHPHAAAKVRDAQQDFVRAVAAECRRLDILLVLELLLYPLGSDVGYVESPQKRPSLVLQSIRDFAAPQFGVDVFKLESPLPTASLAEPRGNSAQTRQARRWFEKIHQAAGRPWVVLSAGATAESFVRVVRFAGEAGASGYLAGRAIWMDSACQFPHWRKVRADLKTRACAYMAQLNKIVDDCAMPWQEAMRGKAKPPGILGMAKNYADFGGKKMR